jgi:hypothetical protein
VPPIILGQGSTVRSVEYRGSYDTSGVADELGT